MRGVCRQSQFRVQACRAKRGVERHGSRQVSGRARQDTTLLGTELDSQWTMLSALSGQAAMPFLNESKPLASPPCLGFYYCAPQSISEIPRISSHCAFWTSGGPPDQSSSHDRSSEDGNHTAKAVPGQVPPSICSMISI